MASGARSDGRGVVVELKCAAVVDDVFSRLEDAPIDLSRGGGRHGDASFGLSRGGGHGSSFGLSREGGHSTLSKRVAKICLPW